MNKMSYRQLAAGLLLLATIVLAPTRQAHAQLTYTPPIKLAALSDDGKPIQPGDLLHTTRTFPNWNLNCEVLLSQGKHICTAELRAIDPLGRQILSWSFALSSDNTPIIVVKVPADIAQGYGVLMLMGAETKFFVPTRADCNQIECVQIAVLDDKLRNMIASQKQVTFSFMQGKEIFRIDAPLAGLAEALDAARRDPVGLVAVQQAATRAQAKKPAVTAMAKPAK